MNEHLKILESGDLNKRNADERKGVRSEALFDFVDIDHYVMRTLHLCKNMVEETQAACEGCSLDYVGAERIWELSMYDEATANTNKTYFRLQMNNTKGNCRGI